VFLEFFGRETSVLEEFPAGIRVFGGNLLGENIEPSGKFPKWEKIVY